MNTQPESPDLGVGPEPQPYDRRLESLLDPVALDQTDDLAYLLSLCGEALGRDDLTEPAAMAEWVVDEWCRVREYDPSPVERRGTDGSEPRERAHRSGPVGSSSERTPAGVGQTTATVDGTAAPSRDANGGRPTGADR